MSRAGATIGVLALVSAVAVIGEAPAGACACGIAIEAEVTEERALVIERPDGEEIILSLDLAGETGEGGERAAVVLPVPNDPEVEAVPGGDPLTYLDEVTALPPEAAGSDEDDAAAAPPVEVIGRELVGGYDVSRLRADDPGALDRWLNRNGYEIDPGAEGILGQYIEQGWAFVAIRLAPGSEGALKPLSVSFSTAGTPPVYPMRLSQLSDVPVDLTLYVLATEARQVEGLEVTWEGETDELPVPETEQLRSLFDSASSYLTKLEADGAHPSQFTTDLEIEEVPEAAPTEGGVAEAIAGDEGGLSAGEIVLVALGGLGLLGVLWLVASRRFGGGSA